MLPQISPVEAPVFGIGESAALVLLGQAKGFGY